MSENVVLLLTNNRPSLFAELRNLLLRERRVVQTAEKLRRNFVGIQGVQRCIHLQRPYRHRFELPSLLISSETLSRENIGRRRIRRWNAC